MDNQLQSKNNNLIGELCLYAGKIMLESGAETYRVEDTMVRIANSYGICNSESYVTPTAIIFSLDGEFKTGSKLKRINKRTTDLNKIAAVNHLSREISQGHISVEVAFQRLREIEATKSAYPYWLQVVAASIASACFVIMFQGTFKDFFPALLAGGVGYFCFLLIDRITKVRFFSEFVASFVIGVTAFYSVYKGFGVDADKIIIGSVMPLVPGVLITNAIRDLMAGHLIAGITKGMEAFLTAFAIGSGVAVIFFFL